KAALAGPVCPEASYPCIGVEQAQRENTPLLRAPCRVKAKRLTKDPKYARPPSPAFTLVLRQPDRDYAAKGDADLIQAQSPLHRARTTTETWPCVSGSQERHERYGTCAYGYSRGPLWAWPKLNLILAPTPSGLCCAFHRLSSLTPAFRARLRTRTS